MKLYFENKTAEITSQGSLFEAITSVSGAQVHSPCGGHGTCRKCTAAAVFCEGAVIPEEAVAVFSEKEREDFLSGCGVPDEIRTKAVIVYTCLVKDASAVKEVYLHTYEKLTGAGVGSVKPIAEGRYFSPLTKTAKVTLTAPTIENPIDTYTNIKRTVENTFRIGIDFIPDAILSSVSVALRRGVTEFYANISAFYSPDRRMMTYLTSMSEEYRTPLALACDIGTTTVAVSLWNAENGTLIGEKVTENPQRKHGSDVISRMSYASDHGQSVNGMEIMFREVIGAVRSSAEVLLEKTGGTFDDITTVAIAGNSVMEHLFCAVNTDSISTVPFFLPTNFGYSVKASDLFSKFGGVSGFCSPSAPVYLAPLAASYVGGDITFGLAYLLTEKEGLDNTASIFLDLGTNGEICCINTRGGSEPKYLFAATAAGPALEGAHIKMGMSATEGAICDVKPGDGKFACRTVNGSEAVGICGSGVISAISAFLKTGLVTAFGRICDDGEAEDETYEDIYPEYEHLIAEDDDGKLTIALDNGVVITEGDIRQVQTAKAAISAGTSVLLMKAGVEKEDVASIFIAGSFGGGIDVSAAAHIGLLPEDAVKTAPDGSIENVSSVGNTSAKGAAMFIFSSAFRANLADVMANCAYIELSSDPAFTDEYVNGMLFGDIE